MPYKFCIVAAMTYCFLMVVWLIVDTIHFVYAMPNEYCNVVTMAYCFVMVVWLIIDTIHFKYAMLWMNRNYNVVLNKEIQRIIKCSWIWILDWIATFWDSEQYNLGYILWKSCCTSIRIFILIFILSIEIIVNKHMHLCICTKRHLLICTHKQKHTLMHQFH